MTLKPSAGYPAELTWMKSSYSTNDGPDCVEVAASSGAAHVRDSKDVEGPSIAFGVRSWARFLSYAIDR